MKKNIFVILLASFFAGSIVAEHEPILAETVEMPGNVVGSLFGGGYAKRSRDKEMKEQDRKDKEAEKKKQQPANRRQARRQRRHSDDSSNK